MTGPVHGRLEVITGCMYAGKTEELLRRIRRARIAGRKVQVFNHELDNRHGVGLAGTHDDLSVPASSASMATGILSAVDADTDTVAVDEAQFFDKQLAEVCEVLVSRGKHVLVAGLDLDYRGKPFGPIPELMALADDVVKLTAICMTCGQSATRSQRVTSASGLVRIGGVGAYEARCREHFSSHEG